MGMRQTFLWFVFYFWFIITSCQLLVYYVPWVRGARVPGRLLGQVPLLNRLGRRKAELRLNALKDTLTAKFGPGAEFERLTGRTIADQVHAHATWAQLSRIFLAVPGIVACVALPVVVTPSTWRTPLWVIGVYLGFVHVSALLTCIDILAVRNADPAGTVTAAAVGVLESFTTRAGKAPAKTTPAAWQSQMIEHLCASLVRRAHRESVGVVPGSRLAMAQSTASAVRALRHRAALVHGSAAGEEVRATHERELVVLVCSVITYSSRPRGNVMDFCVVDAERLADVPESVPDITAVPSPKARVLVPLLFLCTLVAIAVGFGRTGASAEFTMPVITALAMAAAPLALRFGVTVLHSFTQPLIPAPTAGDGAPRPTPETISRAA